MKQKEYTLPDEVRSSCRDIRYGMPFGYGKNRKITVGIYLLFLCIFLAIVVPVFMPWSSTEMHADIRNQGMSFAHPFGTDKFGRDLFVRVWCGVRISLFVGFASALLNGILGILYGAFVGYAGKMLDNLLMRIVDIIASVPSLLYVILIMMVLGATQTSILAGLCISGWIETARIVRGEVMRIKEQEFVLASRLAGAGFLRIFFTHLLPNAAGPIVVSLTLLIPQAIFTEAFLSFMGVGLPAPQASLGTMIQAARSQIFVYPNQMLIPTAVLCILILSLHLIGAGVEEKIRRREGV